VVCESFEALTKFSKVAFQKADRIFLKHPLENIRGPRGTDNC